MLTATTTKPYLFIKHDVETSMVQQGNRHSSQQRNHCLGLYEVAKFEALDSPSRYQPAMDDGTDRFSSRGQIEIKFESTDAAGAANNPMIAAPALPPSIHTSDESPSRGTPNCMEQTFNNRRYSRDWNMSENLHGASAPCSSDEEIDEARRLQSAQPMSHSPGDEDFEFLRNLLQEAEGSPAATALSDVRGISPSPGAAASVSSSWIPVQNHSPTFPSHAGIVPAGKVLAIQVPRVNSSNTISRNAAALQELVVESKLRAADEVAACIWLAGDRVQESLLTRVTNTWGIMEAEMPANTAVGRKFSEVVAGRLEATRLAIEAEMRVADEVATARGEMALVKPDWRGSNILRGDVLTRLEASRIYNIREAPGREPGSSLAESRLDLVRRLRGTREAVIERINSNHKAAATAAGVYGLQLSPAITDDEALMGIDYVVQCVLQQLKVIYPTGRVSFGNIRERLLEKQQAAQTPAAKELLKDHVCSESDSSTGVTSAYSSAGTATSVRRLPSGASPSPKKKRRPGSGGRRCKDLECSRHPHFGFTRPEYCSRHKLPGMFNVKGRRCTNSECARTPVYGKKGDPHPTYCAAHKLDSMVDIKNPTCREQSCNRQPSFGPPLDRRATYCASHMLGGMVNVRRMLTVKGSSRRSRCERSSAADADACIAKFSGSWRGEARAGVGGTRGGW